MSDRTPSRAVEPEILKEYDAGLREAARQGDTERAIRLLERGATALREALLAASRAGRKKTVLALLGWDSARPRPSLADADLRKAAAEAKKCGRPELAARLEGKLRGEPSPVENGPSVPGGDLGVSELYSAARKGDAKAARAILSQLEPERLDESDAKRAWLIAERHGHEATARELARYASSGEAAMFSDLFVAPRAENRDILLTEALADGRPVRAGPYVLRRPLGSGTFGDVFESEDGYAVKIVRAEEVDLVELEAYRQLLPACSAYVVCAREWFVFRYAGQDWLALVQELMSGDAAHLRTDDPADLGEMLVWLLHSLRCLHERGLAHMDVKMANFFWRWDEKNGLVCKLGDPGLACSQKSAGRIPECRFLGSYLPPELLYDPDYPLRRPISFRRAEKIDMWCAGLLMYNVLAAHGYLSKEIADKLSLTASWEAPGKGYARKDVPAIETKIAGAADFGLIGSAAMEETLRALLNVPFSDIPSAEELLDILGCKMGWTNEELARFARKEVCPAPKN